MGGGIAGWLTPGWHTYRSDFAPSVRKDKKDKLEIAIAESLKNGEDPKPLVLDDCKEQCTYWKGKLERCETALEVIIKVNPGKTCMYPMRDYVTCVEACTQPMIHNQLKGAH